MSVTVNCHIDDDTPFTVDRLAGGTWTVDIGDNSNRVTLFASRERLRAFAQQVLDGIPADEEGVDHARAVCVYPGGCSGCVPLAPEPPDDPDATEPAGIVL